MGKMHDDMNEEIQIKLKKWQIPYLVGAAKLGVILEDWCADLVQSSIATSDTHSARWFGKVAYIIEQIEEQTDIDWDDREYGNAEWPIDKIDKWVREESGKILDEFLRAESGHYEQLEKENREKMLVRREIIVRDRIEPTDDK